ncbi:DivIVA domain-containing protein [Faecalispora anaeroviscerum]|uniref:DivIVA domain-containing protein n=1 Tax=Faecalispora anaeroviscerum TaxID=2991836 RepID=UPI0024BBA42F|nr:DivIVA domain-containing protein [Faecalispora anaeroviscerum]
MLTLNDIINVSFRKSNFSGYRTEDVDSFIDQVKDSYDQLLKKTMEQAEAYETLANEKKELEKKLSVLVEKIEDYRQEESEIKNALVSAQKLGESSVREARHKAEIILKDANLKAERVIGTAKADVVEQQRELDDLKKKVVDFRTKLLAIYKEHLTMIDAIPSRKEDMEKEENPAAAEPEQYAEPLHYMPESSPVPAEPEPEYIPEAEKDDFSVDAAVFDTESPNHDLRYDVLKFDEVDESGEQ